MAVDKGAVFGLVVCAVGSGLYVRVVRATWTQDSSAGVDLEWMKSSTGWMQRAQERIQLPLGALVGVGALVFLLMIFFPGTSSDTGVGLWATVVVFLLVFLDLALIATTALFGRPKFLIPPAFRSHGGLITDVWRWLRERRRGDAK